MDELLCWVRAHQRDLIGLIRQMVECESPTGDEASLARMRSLIAGHAAPMAKIRPGKGPHFQCEFRLPGRRKEGRILALGHFDTVWPRGTLAAMPCVERDGRLWGPGVFDMKAGAAFFLFAMKGLRELGIPVRRKVVLRLVADEEIGSPSSREDTAREARRSIAALVLEPAAGLEGKLKTARKGVGRYQLTVHGRAAHSGLDFASGASAVLELARQLERTAALTDLKRGVTLNPGIISGGTRANVVAAEARAVIDLRVVRKRDGERIDRKLRQLKPVDRRCRIEIEGGMEHPPMERSAAIAGLFRLARSLASRIGVDLEETASGGASDGNLTASLGVPTLDGLGAVGEGAHASHESILIGRIADRTALLGRLVESL